MKKLWELKKKSSVTRRTRAGHHHGSDTPTSARAVLHHTDQKVPNIMDPSVRSSTSSIQCQYFGGRGHLATLPPTPTALLDYSKMLIDSTSSFFPSLQFSSTNSPGSKFSTKNYIVNTYMNLFFASSLWFDAIRSTYTLSHIITQFCLFMM